MEKQRKEAITRLEVKISILEVWLSTEIPFSLTKDKARVLDKNGRFVLEYFPTSISALRQWNGLKNSTNVAEEYKIPKQMTSTTTWEATPNFIKERVTGTSKVASLFVRLKDLALIQKDSGRVSRIKELESIISSVKQDHMAIAHEMIALRLENDTLIEENAIADNQIEGQKSLHKREIDWRNKNAIQQKNIITELKKENNALRDSLLKMSQECGVSPDELAIKTNVIPFDLGDK
jgi:hypothetical protein